MLFGVSFARPWILWLILVLLSSILFLKKHLLLKSYWEKVCAPELLQFLSLSGNKSGRGKYVFLAYLGLIFAILALAGPRVQDKNLPTLMTQNAVMIALKTGEDMNQTDIKPSRLVRAKIEVSALMGQVPDMAAGLMVYSDEPFVVSPLADDVKIVENLLPAINSSIMPVDGNRPDRAISFAVQKIKDAGYSGGHIVLFADEENMRLDLALEEAGKALKEGFDVSVYALQKQSEKLKMVAQKGGGAFLSAPETLTDDFVEVLKKKKSDKWQESFEKSAGFEDVGWFLIWVPALILILFFRKGVVFLFLMLLYSGTCEAGFVFSPNQEGQRLFDAQKFDEAAEKFENIPWKASALYKAGKYEDATALFDKAGDVESLYNKGNALAKSGQIEEAIKTYEMVLKQNPQHEDAKFNLEYLKKLLSENQQEQKKSEQNKNGQNENGVGQSAEGGSQDRQDENQAQNKEGDENNEQSTQNDKQEGENDEGSEGQNEPNQSDKQEGEENSDNTQEEKGDKPLEQTGEKQTAPALNAKEGSENEQYDEKVQAREQKFRDIESDPGGLLRAFLKQEYLKRRYSK